MCWSVMFEWSSAVSMRESHRQRIFRTKAKADQKIRIGNEKPLPRDVVSHVPDSAQLRYESATALACSQRDIELLFLSTPFEVWGDIYHVLHPRPDSENNAYSNASAPLVNSARWPLSIVTISANSIFTGFSVRNIPNHIPDPRPLYTQAS